jgi:hypothetical protein
LYLPLFRQYILVEREVSGQSFQPVTFYLNVREATLFAYAQIRILPFPGMEAGVTHFELRA